MKLFKRKQFVLTAMVAMVGLAGYFNWMYKNADNGAVHDGEQTALGEARLVSGTSISEADFFAKSRMERDTGRSKAMESLKSISESADSDEESQKNASQRIMEMAARMEMEAAAEGEIKAKGFSDCVVYINESAVSVIVKSEADLTGTDAAKIQEIIIRIAGIAGDKISISSYNKK